MKKTKAEVIAFLDTLVGTMVINKTDRDYDGQCVTLIKALLEFLGVQNPYAARGDAKDAGDTYIRQGIGVGGRGWLTVVVNRDMGLIGGVRYGHIWIDLLDTANYEQNGAKALRTTKNTRPITQGQQFINLDQWIEEDEVKITRDQIYWHYWTIAGVLPTEQEIKNYEGKDYVFATEDIKRYFANRGLGYYTYRVNAEAKDTTQEATIDSLREALKQKPTEVIIEKPVEVIKEVQVPVEKIVEKEVIKEVVKGDDERTAGDLIAAGLKKILRIK